MEMRRQDFSFDLPQELIAQDPLKDRASSRLLVLDKETGETSHHVFREIKDYLHPVEIDNGFLARRGLTPTREYSDTVGHSIFPIAAQFTKDYYCLDMTPEAIMAEWLDMARDAYARQVPMKPGAEAFLARCAAAGDAG